jgi:hypothetical protein
VCERGSADVVLCDCRASGASVQYLVAAVTSLSCEENVSAEQIAVMQTAAEAVCELVTRQCPEALEVVKQLPQAMRATPTYSLLRAAVASPSISSAVAEAVGAVMLSSQLEEPPLSMLEAVSQQATWQYSSLPQATISLYSDLLSVLGTTHFAELLQKALSVEQLNWPALLQAVVCFLHRNQSTPRLLNELVEGLVSEGLEEGDTHLLVCGLLFARQASLEGSHLFTSYGHWLQNVFGDRSGTFIKGKKELLFLLKTLSALVPHDPVFALKAHVSHSPRQLTKCLAQVNDYITLVSTRLQDLGEKVPSGGKTDVDARQEVEEAIEHYSCTGSIPQSVMEASRFRQPYYLGRFLPSLLCPSSTCCEPRDQFISALAREKIIPPRMMRRYEKACQEMKGREVESVTGDVVSILEELPRVVREGGVASLLSRLSSCLREESLSPVRALQLVDHILSAIGKTLVTEWESKDRGYRWVGDLLAVLSSHTSLHSPLYARLNELLTSQFVELVATQLFAVAVLLCQAFHAAPPMAGLELNGTALCTGKEFCLDLLCQLRHDMPTQALRFCCMFMEQFIHIERETPLPTCLLRKMVYIYKRARFLHSTFPENTVLEAVERLLLENHHIAEQWHSCKVM